jgi:NTP pyrophosphatase (non-canonical NTP hydrolase)
MPRSYRDIELDVIRWAEARKIIPNATLTAQARKTTEEAGELLEAATILTTLDELIKRLPHLAHVEPVIEYRNAIIVKLRDGIGDVLVTLINTAALADVDVIDCLEDAYQEIKDRKGTLLADGTFVKESATPAPLLRLDAHATAVSRLRTLMKSCIVNERAPEVDALVEGLAGILHYLESSTPN